MSDNAVVSLIIPVYQVESYLSRCLDSVINQTYRELDIILVDDGSTDRSAEICDLYAGNDSRIRVIHQENGGLSSARNSGLKLANGRYIGFIDSDDYIEPDMIANMLSLITSNNADIAICNIDFIDEQENPYKDVGRDIIKDDIFTSAKLHEFISKPENFPYVTVWNKVYKREIFENLMFKEGVLHEDEFIIHHIAGKASTIVSTSKPYYHYIRHGKGITGDTNNIRHLDTVAALCDRYEYYQKTNEALCQVTIRRAYTLLVYKLRESNFKSWPDEYKKLLSKVFRILLSRGDLRSVKLMLEKNKSMRVKAYV